MSSPPPDPDVSMITVGVDTTGTPSAAVALSTDERVFSSVALNEVACSLDAVLIVTVTRTDAASTDTCTSDSDTPKVRATLTLTNC